MLPAVAADIAGENLPVPRMVDDLLLLARQHHPDRQLQITKPLADLNDVDVVAI